MIPIIDLHAHILPGIDDGARNTEEAVRMCQIASAGGVQAIVATSHGNLGELSLTQYKDAYRLLYHELKKNEIPIRLYSGMEIFMNHEAVEKLERKALLTLNRTAYVLVEFDFEEELWMVEEYLEMLLESGYIPVIAHAERYRFVQRHPEAVFRWVVRDSCVIQVNKGSFFGVFGKAEQEMALSLLRHNLVHIVASDTHGSERRTPDMSPIFQFLGEVKGSKYRDMVLSENPGRILLGKEIAGFRPESYRRNRY